MSMAPPMGPPATPSRHRSSASAHSFTGNEYRAARGTPGRATYTPTTGGTPYRAPSTPHHSTPSGQRTHAANPGVSAVSSVSAASLAVASPVLEQYTPDVYSAEPGSYSTSAPSTPARAHRVSRSVGCLPVSPAVAARKQSFESPSQTKVREPSLPPNPSVWTPSELAQYLSWALRVGGADARGPTLPAPVVEDVVSWVLRSRVDGRQFIKGIDQGPPPFLPVLETASRRLRRRNGRRMSDAMSEADVTDEDGGVEGVTRVRRLAHAYDIISSASEASGDDESLSALRAQLTGDSVHGFGRATPKTEPRAWARRDSTTSTASLASGVSAASVPRWSQRVSSDTSSVGLWPDDGTFNSPTAPLRAKMETKAANELAELAALANSAHAAKAANEAGASDANEASPPPPYDTASVLPSPARPGLLFPPADAGVPGTPSADSTDRSGSATPLRSALLDDATVDSPHLAHMGGHRAVGVDPYAVLRREGNGKRPNKPGVGGITGLPGSAGDAGSSDESDKENRSAHWSTTRRVTARPRDVRDALAILGSTSPASAPPRTPSSNVASAASTPGSRGRRRPRDMHREVASLTTRIRELEERLAAVETPPASALASAFTTSGTTSVASGTSGASDVTGASGDPADTPSPTAPDVTPPRGRSARASRADDDGAEPRLRDVPAVLFLMGVGVGVGFSAVVVRLLMHRKLLGAA